MKDNKNADPNLILSYQFSYIFYVVIVFQHLNWNLFIKENKTKKQ